MAIVTKQVPDSQLDELPLPPGTLPLVAVRSAVAAYKQGRRGRDGLIASVDRHAEALHAELEQKLAQQAAEFLHEVRRLEILHERLSINLAQRAWLSRWPGGPSPQTTPLTCRLPSGRSVAVPQLLALLRRLDVDPRVIRAAATRPRSGPRGRGPAMAAIADAGVSTVDIGHALDVHKATAWAILQGHLPLPEHAPQALRELLGDDQATVVLDAIPPLPRSRALGSPAVRALHDAGVNSEDVARVAQVAPPTVRRWLSGNLRPPRALAGALEQLVGPEHTQRIMGLIPHPSGRDR